MRAVLLLACAVVGCGALPAIEYEGERIELAVDFAEPVCEGTIADLDAHVDFVETVLGRPRGDDPLRIYWLRGDLEPWCGDGPGGCFFPGTHVMIASEPSLTHEIVHAVVGGREANGFLEEGLADALSGQGVVHDPRLDSRTPTQRLHGKTPRGADDYAAAHHFIAWVGASRPDGYAGLVQMLDANADASRIEQHIAAALDAEFSTIVDRYRRGAPAHLAGVREQAIPALDPLRGRMTVELDCDDVDTRGPWVDDRIYRAYVVQPDRSARIHYAVEGDASARVDIFDPYASIDAGFVTEWRVPDPDIDPDAVRIDVGAWAQVAFEAGRPRLVVFSTDASGGRVTLATVHTPTPQ